MSKTLVVNQVFKCATYDRTTETHKSEYFYRPVKVTNSVTPKIGENLSLEQLDGYCESDEWSVTIK